jgi:hypothetical protein
MYYSELFQFKVPEQDDIYDIDHVEINVGILERILKRLLPIVTEEQMSDFINTDGVQGIEIGQVVIAAGKVYTYTGGDRSIISNYCRCGASDYLNIATPFYNVFTMLPGSDANWSAVVLSSQYSNPREVAEGFVKVYSLTDVSVGDYSTSQIASIAEESDVEPAFDYVFGGEGGTDTSGDAMDESEVDNALSTEWDGSSSEDPTAMSADDVNEAVATKWEGESSEDEEAITAEEINSITG